MKFRPALTLIEILLVFALIALSSVGAIYAFSTSRQNQAISLSAENLAVLFRKAHIFSRESKDEKSWGIRIINDRSYALVWRNENGEGVSFTYQLTPPATFAVNEGYVWFDQGTGYTAGEVNVSIQNPKGDIKTVNISQLGIVKVW